MKIRIGLFLVLATGCSGPATSGPTTPTPVPDAAPAPVPRAFEAAALLTGDWTAAAYGTTLSWLRPGRPDGAIYGVALSEPTAVWVIDDEPTAEPADARWLRLALYDGGAETARTCDQDRDQPEGLWFGCDDAAGGTLRFWQNGDLLDYEVSMEAAGPFTFHHSPAEVAGAPALEDADRAFARDTAARGADGWTAWFADDGVMWSSNGRSLGSDAIHATITPVLADLDLSWQPTVSRLAGDGTIGVTAGTFEVRPDGGGEVAGTGTYVTVWRQDPAGWRVIFDVGRPDA